MKEALHTLAPSCAPFVIALLGLVGCSVVAVSLARTNQMESWSRSASDSQASTSEVKEFAWEDGAGPGAKFQP